VKLENKTKTKDKIRSTPKDLEINRIFSLTKQQQQQPKKKSENFLFFSAPASPENKKIK
jgi:hypothetical protein